MYQQLVPFLVWVPFLTGILICVRALRLAGNGARRRAWRDLIPETAAPAIPFALALLFLLVAYGADQLFALSGYSPSVFGIMISEPQSSEMSGRLLWAVSGGALTFVLVCSGGLAFLVFRRNILFMPARARRLLYVGTFLITLFPVLIVTTQRISGGLSEALFRPVEAALDHEVSVFLVIDVVSAASALAVLLGCVGCMHLAPLAEWARARG